MHIVVLGGTNDDHGILSDFTKKRIEKCYEMLYNESNVNVHFSGGFNEKFNSTNISHSQLCVNYFEQINKLNIKINKQMHEKNNNTVDEAIHFGEYFKNNDSKIKIITNDWHINRVIYLFEKTFKYYNVSNYEFISIKSNTEDEILIQNETNKIKELNLSPYGKWKEFLNLI